MAEIVTISVRLTDVEHAAFKRLCANTQPPTSVTNYTRWLIRNALENAAICGDRKSGGSAA